MSEIKIGGGSEGPKSLRFYVDGDPQLVFPLYELIFNNATAVEFRPKETPVSSDSLKTMVNLQGKLPDPVMIPASEAIRPVGFTEDEAVIPYTKRSFPGYRLLTEYFTFPYKFLFFDVHGLDLAAAKKFGPVFDINIHLKDVTPPSAPISAETFRMGCTPIINLFSKLADPIYLSQQKYEYQVIPDVHRQLATEVYSIDEVITSDPQTNTTHEYSPFYSVKHTYGTEPDRSYWYATRRKSQRPEDDGTEVFLSLVNMNFDPAVPPVEVLNVKTTCTNRDLPGRLPFGGSVGEFEVEGAAALSKVRCLTKPTAAVRPSRRRAAQWRLISHLSLNYLSIVSENNGAPEALQELLQLYNVDDSVVNRNQILGLTGIETRPAVRQIGGRIGAGFVRGLETTLEFDEDLFVGSGMFLFASVLDRFLGLYASLSSFTQLVVRSKQREEVVRRFEPRAGEQVLL